MSFDMNEGFSLTRRSSGDTSSYQYRLMALSTTNANDGCVLATARGQLVHGVWQNNATAAEYGKLKVAGVSKVAAGDSSAMETGITEGTLLKASSIGQAVPSTAGTVNPLVIGYALEALSTGSTGIIAAMIIPALLSTAT